MKTWFITGAGSGMGRCIAENVLGRGDCAVVSDVREETTADYPERFGDRVIACHLDITDPAEGEAVFQAGIDRFGGIDVCVNNAGFVTFGALEDIPADQAHRIMETNFFGTYNISRLAARHMRERRRGAIIQMSSLSAVDVLAGYSLYAASKWAVEGMSLALADELRHFGVRVILVEPGEIRTGIEKRAQVVPAGAYEEILRAGMNRWRDKDDSGSGGDPVRCAEVIVRLGDCEDPPVRLALTTFAYEVAQQASRARIEEAEAWKEWSAEADVR